MATRIIYEGDEAVAHTHLPRAQNLMHKVREFVAASGAGVFSQTLVLDDTSYAYCLKVGALESIYIFSQPDNPLPDIPVDPFPILPDFYSGVVRDGLIRTDYTPAVPPQTEEVKTKKLEFFKPNAVTMKRNDDGKDKLTVGYQAVKKLAVEPHGIYFPTYVGGIGEENPDRTKARRLSQYLGIRPSHYTGKMQKLAQIVLGYGRVQPLSVVEPDPKTRAAIIKDGLQMIYDFRWHRSHGVVTSEDGKLWLLEISNINGVIAMQLPMFANSKQRLEDSPWNDYQAVIEEFGGLPSGYGFPPPSKLKKAIEEGTILRLLTLDEMHDYFKLQNYSSMCGWAFNEKGSEAHNTGWEFGEDGMKRSYHYCLNITIGAVKKKREKGEPIAPATCKLVLAGSGRLFHSSRKYPPPFKYHEPLLGALLSMDFLPSLPDPENPTAYSVRVICDCPMFVYYADDQLKVVSYFWNRFSYDEPKDTNDFEDCMYVGSWTQTLTSGVNYIPALFYTSDYDDREQLPGFQMVSTTTGADVGTYQVIQDHIDDIRLSDYSRRKYFRKTTVSEFNNGLAIVNSIIIPDGLRNGCVYAVGRFTQSSWVSKAIEYTYLMDPNWYGGYRALYSVPPKGDCFVKEDRKVRDTNFDSSNKCALDLANEGSWASRCDAIPATVPGFTQTGTGSSTTPKATEKIVVTLNTGTVHGNITLPQVRAGAWSAFQERSPNDEGDLQNMACMHSADIGEPHIYYATRLNAQGTDYATRGSLLVDAVSDNPSRIFSYNFVGVP